MGRITKEYDLGNGTKVFIMLNNGLAVMRTAQAKGTYQLYWKIKEAGYKVSYNQRTNCIEERYTNEEEAIKSLDNYFLKAKDKQKEVLNKND